MTKQPYIAGYARMPFTFAHKAATALKREGKMRALATQCIGGGMGIAMILEAA